MTHIIISYAVHRCETIAPAAEIMAGADAVILEEPPDAAFRAMIKGKASIDAYLSATDTEYPEFSRRSCRMMRALHTGGIRFLQVEPYLQQLLHIHRMFAHGRTPADIPTGTTMMDVYTAEKHITRALIRFYAASVHEIFEDVLEAVKTFARLDAGRFRLRDRMRAAVIASIADRYSTVYIEAGPMHLWLRKELKRLVVGRHRIDSRHLLAPPTRTMTGRRVLRAPGDNLTATYIFHPNARSLRCDRMAARSIIYNKLVAKEEYCVQTDGHPHLLEEWRVLQSVARLDIADCAQLFPHLRRANTRKANAIVDAYLHRHSKCTSASVPGDL